MSDRQGWLHFHERWFFADKPPTVVSTADSDPDPADYRTLECGCTERRILGSDVLTTSYFWILDHPCRRHQ